MSSYCLVASVVFDKKAAFSLIEDSLYVMNCFSLATCKILCLSTVYDYDVSRCGSLSFYLTWSSFSFICRLMLFIKLAKF